MTCIAAIAEDGRVTMGGDSAGVSGLDLEVRADAKVFRKGEFLIGFTSSFRMGQVLRYSFDPPTIHSIDADDLFSYMVKRFVEEVRKVFQAAGCARKYLEEESAGIFLVGLRGRLFRIGADYQVAEQTCGFDAIGCGDQVTKGALLVMNSSFAPERFKPEGKIELALRAAERFSAGVRSPFHIETLERFES